MSRDLRKEHSLSLLIPTSPTFRFKILKMEMQLLSTRTEGDIKVLHF